MTTNYNQRYFTNPNFGFNKLSVGNPFNFYGYQNSGNYLSKPKYSINTYSGQKTNLYNNFIFEENKVGLKTNPKQPPMTNTYNLNTFEVKTEQKYNPYYAGNNYPQKMDRIKDLMNYTYSEEKAPTYYKTNQYDNITYENYEINTPQSSRIPNVDNDIFNTLMNKNYHYSKNNKNYNDVYTTNETNYLNNNQSTENANYLNDTLVDNNYSNNKYHYRAQSSGFINTNPNINETAFYQNQGNENLKLSYQTNSNNNYITTNKTSSNIIVSEIVSDINSREYYTESNGNLVKSYAYSEEPNTKHREYMEDQGIAIENFGGDPNKILFGLFDGHGGGEVSKFLQQYLGAYMKKMMPFKNYFEDFINLFKILDNKIKALNCPDVGSTATIIYMEKKNNKKILYCVNVGDSRCIIVNKKGVMRLSEDDRVDVPKEKERIIRQGGIISNNRIYGQLMLSRGFGDWGIKQYGLICEPHIAKIEINENDLFLVIASDGVWDVMSDEDFKDIMQESLNPLDICKDIVIESLRRGSSDNISCFVIKF